MLSGYAAPQLLRWTHPPFPGRYNSTAAVVLYPVTMYLHPGAFILRRISLMRRFAAVLFAFSLTSVLALAAAPARAYSQDQDQPPASQGQDQPPANQDQ